MAGVRRDSHWGHHSVPVQQAGCAVVDALAIERVYPWPHRDGASLGIVEGGPCRGVAAQQLLSESSETLFPPFPFSLPLPLHLPPLLEVGQQGEGEGSLEDMAVPAKVGTMATAAEDALLPRGRSRK
jgi:hypothetical protein